MMIWIAAGWFLAVTAVVGGAALTAGVPNAGSGAAALAAGLAGGIILLFNKAWPSGWPNVFLTMLATYAVITTLAWLALRGQKARR